MTTEARERLGMVECPTCRGSGMIQSWYVEDCEDCGGFGLIEASGPLADQPNGADAPTERKES